MTAKKSVKKSAPAKQSRRKPSAAVKTEPAPPILSAGGPPEPCAAAGVSEAEIPAVNNGAGAAVEKILTGSMISLSVKRVVAEMILIAVVVLALQLGWSAVKLAGRSIEIFRQFRQWQEWQQENIPIPGPDGLDGIRKYIKKNFPRTIPASERETAAQVFADAAAAVDKGGLINRDDVLGYLGENLRPACKAPAWVGFLSNVWTELDLAADASPDALSGALREVSRSLNEARAFPLLEAVDDLTVSEPEAEKEPADDEGAEPVLAPEAAKPESEPAGAHPEPGLAIIGSRPPAVAPAGADAGEPAANNANTKSNNCPSGNCPVNRYPSYYYGGYGWF